MASTNEILIEQRGPVTLVTLNRPKVLNAFNQAMFQQFRTIITAFGRDPKARVLVISGAGKAFSSGEDLTEAQTLLIGEENRQRAYEHVKMLQDITRLMVGTPKIIIAAINGIAVGAGAEIAIASDIRIASKSASFMFAEVKRGLFETNGVMYLLPRLVGSGRAMEWMLTGDKIKAADAHKAGLVTRLVGGRQLLKTALNLAEEIADNAPIPVSLVKRVLARTYDVDLEAMLGLEVEAVMEVLGSEDLTEGLKSFAEKRKPVYRGK
jgi:enoyl-CoA hydratase/carnithine racemase